MATGLQLLNKLPLEIRLDIYRYYISDILKLPSGDKPLVIRDNVLAEPNALCQVSDQIHNEMGQLLVYPHYTFIMNKPQSVARDVKLGQLHPNCGFQLECVQNLTFQIRPNFSLYRSNVATYYPHNARAFRKRMPALKTVRVMIRFDLDATWRRELSGVFRDIILGYLNAFDDVESLYVCYESAAYRRLTSTVVNAVKPRLGPNVKTIPSDDLHDDPHWKI